LVGRCGLVREPRACGVHNCTASPQTCRPPRGPSAVKISAHTQLLLDSLTPAWSSDRQTHRRSDAAIAGEGKEQQRQHGNPRNIHALWLWLPGVVYYTGPTPRPELELISNSSSSPKLTLALEIFGWKGYSDIKYILQLSNVDGGRENNHFLVDTTWTSPNKHLLGGIVLLGWVRYKLA
jgi:hypothetical protein